MTEFAKTIPILRSFDEAKAKEFYADFLGFQVDWEHRFAPDAPLYMSVSRAGLTLHISEHYGDALPGAAVFVETSGLHEYHAELITKRYKFLAPGIGDAPWNAWCMEVLDPFGNKLRFSESKPGRQETRPPGPTVTSQSRIKQQPKPAKETAGAGARAGRL